MKNLRNISALFILSIAFTFGACAQDETMDEVIENAEINSPSPSNEGTTTDSNEEKP